MKKLLMVLLVLLLSTLACGGGGGGGGDDNNGDGLGMPTITSVGGTGEGGTVLDRLLVIGTNFDSSMDVFLVGSNNTVSLDFEIESDTRFTAVLPTDIEPGDFELVVQNVTGEASAPLSLLKGEQGDPGISLAHHYYCGPSGDIDQGNEQVYGEFAHIYEFNDGSYFIDCMISYISGGGNFWDTSTAVRFYKGSFVEAYGYVSCIAMYAHADYYPAENRVRYERNTDPTQYEDVTCIMVY